MMYTGLHGHHSRRIEMAVKLLDGAVPATLTRRFSVGSAAGMIYAENLSGDIALEVKTEGSFMPVLEDGVAVVLSLTGNNPLGIYVEGEYRVVAAALAATEKVYFK